MERRNFIKSALLTAGAFSLPSSRNNLWANRMTEVNASTAAPVFKKSIMWGTVGMEGTVLDKCKAIKAAGYDGIEPNSHMDREEVLAAMKATGLMASSVCCSTHWAKPLSDPDPAVRQEGVEGMIVALEDAKAYGTDAVLLVPGTVTDSVSYDECWSRSVVEIKKLLPVAEKLKITICFENVWNNFLLSPIEARSYIDQFKSPYAKFYFDCGNILVYGWPEQWIRILGDKVGRIHIKEFNKQIADKEGRWAGFGAKLTEGDVNWQAVMKESRAYYKGGWMTTEQGNSNSPEDLKDLGKRLDKVLAS